MNTSTKIIILALGLIVVTFGMQFLLKLYTDPIHVHGRSADETPVQFLVGDTKFEVPQNFIRIAAQRNSNPKDRIDLYFHWPSFSGYSMSNSNDFDNPNTQERVLFVTVERLDNALPPPGRRLDGLYRRFFEGNPWRGPAGLLGQGFSASSGYANEELYYAKEGDATFIARCLKNNEDSSDSIRRTCLYDFALEGNLVATVRFDKSLLESWREVSAGAKRKVMGMLAL